MRGKWLQVFCLYLLTGGIEYFVSVTQMQCNHHPSISNSSAQVGRVYWVIQCLLKPANAYVHVWSEGICTAPSACVSKTGPHTSPPNGFPSLSKKAKVCNENLTKSHDYYSSVAEPREIMDVTSFYDSRKWQKFPDNSRKWDGKWMRCGCSHTCSCTER